MVPMNGPEFPQGGKTPPCFPVAATLKGSRGVANFTAIETRFTPLAQERDQTGPAAGSMAYVIEKNGTPYWMILEFLI
jgi:hypothetical protein